MKKKKKNKKKKKIIIIIMITYVFVSRLQNVSSQAQTGYGNINQPDLECWFISEPLSLFLECS